jgi:hypothetical protein
MSDGLPQTMPEALTAEAEIAEQAAFVREEHGGPGIDRALFMKLWPLLCKPIQPAFIQTVGPTKGKPYPSTGIRSVQVQIDRMNNVLTPACWWYEDEYELEGKLCTVKVCVGMRGGFMALGPIVSRSSKGGVQQGSTIGNIYKGSFTNAAKLAFARLGPGHEVYVGATDLDPDVSSEMASSAPEGDASTDGTISVDIAKRIVDRAWQVGEKERLRLAASKLVGRDIGDCGSKDKAAKALAGALTYAQAEELDNWLSTQADKAAAREGG